MMVFIVHFVMMMMILTSFKRVIQYLPSRHQRPSNWKTYAQKEVNLLKTFFQIFFHIKLIERNVSRLVCIFHRKSSGKPES